MVNTHSDGGEKRSTDAGALDRFVAAARVDEAVRERRRAQHRALLAQETALVSDVLLGALQDPDTHPVTLHLRGGSSVTGQLGGLGADVVDLSTASHHWWLALEHVLAVETGAGLHGDPADRDEVRLVDLLGDLVDTGHEIQVLLGSGSELHGEVRAAGSALVLAAAHPPRTVVVALEAISGVRRPR